MEIYGTSHLGRTFSRRSFLEAGTLALFGAGVATHPVNARPRSGVVSPAAATAKRCILVYLLGGPPHQDMWDMKPDAPAEIRGPFAPIDSAVPGIQVCEHMPKLARQTNRLAIVRSVGYRNSDHPFMIYHTLTGRVSPRALGANTVLAPSRDDDPHMGSVVAKFAHANRAIPGYVAIPEVRVRMAVMPVSGGGRAGFLGAEYDPLAINEDPLKPEAGESLVLPSGISELRFQERQELLAVLDGFGPRQKVIQDYEAVRSAALRLTGTPDKSDGLVSLQNEPSALRDRYGRHRFGQSMLLARRLVERGVSFVAVHFNYMSKCDGWDTHANNFTCLKNELLPLFDQGLAALIDDLADRGLLDETLVVAMGEFGRTPKINANAGRDHWGECGSVVFAGGGIPGGQIIGASDANGAYITNSPHAPPDVVATIYHRLGINPHQQIFDLRLNRTMTLCDGKAIAFGA